MGASLPVGSLAFAVPQQEYFVGDIVTFKIPDLLAGRQVPDELLTHRVVDISEVKGFGSSVAATPWVASLGRGQAPQLQVGAIKKYKTQGDANNVVDDWELTDDAILGKVIFHLPYLGYLLRLPQILVTAVLQTLSF